MSTVPTTAARFARHSSATTSGGVAERLAQMESRSGPVGAMVSTMAGSPSTLVGYHELSRAMGRSRLPRTLTERISLAVQSNLDCALCLAAHTDAARGLGIDEAEIALAKQGTSADPRLAQVVAFGWQVHVDPASTTDDDVARLRALGLTDRDILDIVALVALNVLTGSFNLVAGLEPLN
ncbi:carboxymuconolactone decarboxylase family protein [Euzebya rosea]|uniref:carboxymuconolactone decarboxylase family protein n=1 Tax=Euzebya rosea TaxID=2052804 RepID=UPI000D3E6BD4|nr:carboxymuconolactone decarboxylase family protein [Euzebya rosea]